MPESVWGPVTKLRHRASKHGCAVCLSAQHGQGRLLPWEAARGPTPRKKLPSCQGCVILLCHLPGQGSDFQEVP